MRGFTATEPSPRTIVVVGEGLIGRAISSRLRRRRAGTEWHLAVDWTDDRDVGAQLARALADSPVGPTELIWSAGVSGMTLDENTLVDRRRAFDTQLSGVLAACSSRAVRVHYLSSAGALGPPGGTTRFETGTVPYAHLKAAEEDALERLDVDHVVYRISSTYGTPRPGSRSGAIGVLVENALRGRETLLYARSTTMRNYVHASDVAEAIVRNLDTESSASQLLAAKRSHPMFEVIGQVERLTRHPVAICYRPPTNDHDMVFDPRQTSPLLPERSLESGIRMVIDGILAQ